MKKHSLRRYSKFLWFFGLILFIFSCNLLDRPGDLQSTASAVNAQQTNLAWTVTALAAQASLGTPLPTRVVLSAEPATPASPEALRPTIPVIAATTETAPDISDERLLKSAKILLFEDMSASRYIRLVKEALDEAGYFYLDVGSATGWFKSQLLSGVEWDLVIAAAEAEREFGGEFFEFIDARLERGAAVIIENWDLDSAPMGRVKPMLDRCGVSVQSDWFEPEMRVFFWTDPAHPIFNYPNRITSGLRNVVPLWRGDVGDLLQSNTSAGMSAGNALILAADNGSQANDHGLLVTCLDGRMIVQTFRSHDYHHNDMVALWQNYIYQALISHFSYTQASLPTPVATYLPTSLPEAPIPQGPTPGPDYTLPHACGAALTARLVETPDYRRDLFEHHASGTFVILRLELVNQSTFPIQIWDQDYSLQEEINGKQVNYTPHVAATGYLYIERPSNLYQDLIQPGETWRTSLAFDVPREGQQRRLVIRPGSEFNQQVCQVGIPIDR